MSNLKNKRLTNLIIIVILAAFSFVLSMSDICFPSSKAINYSDGSIYQYIGHLMLRGKMPYLDAFDHKGILLYCLNALGCLIDQRWGIWCLDFLFMCGIIYFSYRTARLYFDEYPSILICILVYSDFANGHWVWNTPDFFALFFETVVMYIVAIGLVDKEPLTLERSVITGLSIAAGFWLKQTVIMPMLLMLLIACLNDRFAAKKKGSYFYLFSAGLSFLIPSALIIGIMRYKNALTPMFNDYFLYNIKYADHDMKESCVEVLSAHLNNSGMIIAIVFGVISFIVIKKDRQAKLTDKGFIYGPVMLLVILIYLSLWGRQYRQYYLMCYPVLIFIVSSSFLIVSGSFGKRDGDDRYNFIRKWAEIAVCIGMVFCLLLNISALFNQIRTDHSTPATRRMLKEAIDEVCEENDNIAIATPNEAGLYMATGHESTTTYPYIQILQYDDPGFLLEYNRQIKEAYPKAILCMTWQDADSLFDNTVCDMYNEYLQIGEYILYVRKDVKKQ